MNQSPSRFCLLFPNPFHGLLTKWIDEINSKAYSKRFSKVPSGVLAWIIMELAKLLKIVFHSLLFFGLFFFFGLANFPTK